MKITLHLTSVVVGGAVALALGVVAGFSPQATQIPAQQQSQASPLYSQAWPKAEDIVVLTSRGDDWGGLFNPICLAGTGRDSQVFTVPPGRILVVSSLSTSVGWGANVRLVVDGALLDPIFPAVSDFGVGLVALTEGQTLQLLAPECPSSSGPPEVVPGKFVSLHCYLEDA